MKLLEDIRRGDPPFPRLVNRELDDIIVNLEKDLCGPEGIALSVKAYRGPEKTYLCANLKFGIDISKNTTPDKIGDYPMYYKHPRQFHPDLSQTPNQIKPRYASINR